MLGKAVIYYLSHSGFAIETENYFMIFDYYKDKAEGQDRDLTGGVVSMEDLAQYNNISIFVSHSHYDHFNPVVFEWGQIHPGIRYFLSDDVSIPENKGSFHRMAPYQEFRERGMRVKTYGSTDMGVSFLVEVDGLNIFHAGDLNCWYWYYESTSRELEEDRQKFIIEMEKMEGEKVDIAFFPVDPRLKEYYFMGGEYFIKQMKPKLFIPMHFGEEYSITEEFAYKVRNLQCKTAIISRRGQRIYT